MASPSSNRFCLMLVGALLAGPFSLPTKAAMLLGIDWNGNLYQISTNDASLAYIGNTGLDYHLTDPDNGPCSLECGPDGALYCFTSREPSCLYVVDPETAQATTDVYLNTSITPAEGGLAFASDGTAYGASLGSYGTPKLFTFDLLTGNVTNVCIVSGANDINGLAWRRDGKLVGLDHVTNSNCATLLAIDPMTGDSSVIVELPFAVGRVSGMTAQEDDTGYFATGGHSGDDSGSNELYFFNLNSGAYKYIGSFSTNVIPDCSTNVITSWGISGLALLPGPQTVAKPRLSIALLSDTQAQVSWRRQFVEYALESTPSLPATAWIAVTNCASLCGDGFSVVIGVDAERRFFRLRRL